MHGFHELGIQEEILSKFMRLHIHPSDNSYALDIRHSSIMVSNYSFKCCLFVNPFYEKSWVWGFLLKYCT